MIFFFGPEAICHYWLDNYDLAMQSVSKIKIARTHLFYLSLILFKKNELSEASKKLKEAVAITDMDFQAFVNSEPYKDEKYKKADSRFSFNRKLLKNRSFDYFYKVIRLSYV